MTIDPEQGRSLAPRLAYLILAHSDWTQLARLVHRLDFETADIFLHVDAKSAFDQQQFRDLIGDSRVYFVEPRLKVYWGDISIVHATISLLRAAKSHCGNYDRLVLLSGQDYPIRSNQEIVRFFSANTGTEFLEFAKLPVRWWPYGGMDRVQVYNFPRLLGRRGNQLARAIQMSLGIRRSTSRRMTFYGSSQWFSITGNALDVVLDAVDNSDLLKVFSWSYCPDELFFQTILLNSHLAANCRNRHLRFMSWRTGDPGPLVLAGDDFDKLPLDDGSVLFARKFRTDRSRSLLDRIDAMCKSEPASGFSQA